MAYTRADNEMELQMLDEADALITQLQLAGALTGFEANARHTVVERKREKLKGKMLAIRLSMFDREHERKNFITFKEGKDGMLLRKTLRGEWVPTTVDQLKTMAKSGKVRLKDYDAHKADCPANVGQACTCKGKGFRPRSAQREKVASEATDAVWVKVTREQGKIAQEKGFMVRWVEDGTPEGCAEVMVA